MCNCYDGLLGEDDYGEPIYCENCTQGLDLAMGFIAKRMMDLAESAASYPNKHTKFWNAIRAENDDAYQRYRAEHDRLEALYNALGGYRATMPVSLPAAAEAVA